MSALESKLRSARKKRKVSNNIELPAQIQYYISCIERAKNKTERLEYYAKLRSVYEQIGVVISKHKLELGQ
jgi:hypothetical protein